MEEDSIVRKAKSLALKIVSDVIFLLCLFSLFTILAFHVIVPFFPVLFLFDFCFLVGYPLFLRYVLKRKWFVECIKDEYLKIKYILAPYVIMEMIVLLYYHKATYFIIKTVMENNG